MCGISRKRLGVADQQRAVREGHALDEDTLVAAAAALVRFLLEQDAGNAQVMNEWLAEWTPQVLGACDAMAPLFDALDVPVQRFATARATGLADAPVAPAGHSTPRADDEAPV